MQALPRQTPPRRDTPEPETSAMDANSAAIALATAMNDARAALAAREVAAEEARGAALARMQALRGKLVPLYAAIPRDVEMFDLGFATPEKPRLFVDIVAYVEPTREGTGYRFVQETRSGRKMLLETEDEAALIREITRYVAQRLVVRERALAQGEEDAPQPMIRQPAPVMPMTAEEAFRQWTRGTTSPETGSAPAQENTPPAPLVSTPSPAADQTAATAAAAPASTEPARADAAGENPQPRGQSHQPSPVRSWPEVTARPASRGQGWWLWPTTALLIGASLGVLAIYLYAAKLT